MSRTTKTLLRFNKEEQNKFDDLVKFFNLEGVPVTQQIRILLNTLHKQYIKTDNKEL